MLMWDLVNSKMTHNPAFSPLSPERSVTDHIGIIIERAVGLRSELFKMGNIWEPGSTVYVWDNHSYYV